MSGFRGSPPGSVRAAAAAYYVQTRGAIAYWQGGANNCLTSRDSEAGMEGPDGVLDW